MRRRNLSNPVLLFTAVLLLLPVVTLQAAEPLRFFVSLEGNDAGSGTSKSPFRTLEAARDAVRQLSAQERAKQPIEICLFPGTYIRKAPLIFSAQDSGTKKAPVIYRSWTDQPTVFSGGKEVSQWTKTDFNGHPVLVADLSKLPGGYAPFEQVWVNSHRAIQARTPNSGYFRTPFDETQIKSMTQGLRGQMEGLPYHADDELHLDGVEDGVVVAFYKWLEFHIPIERIDRANKKIVFAGKSMRRVETNERFYLEGGKAMLDQPGEWYLDRQGHKLYYYPMAGESDIVASIPSLTSLVRFEGDARKDQFVEYVQFKGLTFSHTTWVMPRDSGGASYGQADIQMDGAVRLEGARHCLLEDCEITAVGNYGLEISVGCSQNQVLRCDIHDLGAGGILIGPKIRPRGKTPVLDHPADATSENEVADCRIYDGGRYFHCAVGVWVGQSPNNNVHHNEIYNFYYSAISTGWTWSYGAALATGNRYEYNHIHHLGRLDNGDGPMLSDLGGIYFLGNQTGTVVRHNVFHDIWAGKYGGWALYTDQGTRNLLVENNLAYRCKHACFNQHFGKDNIIRNNIFAFADTSVVMLARMEEHTGFILTNNILLSDGTPIYAGGYAYDVNAAGAFKSDKNLVWSTAGEVMGAQNRFSSRLYEPEKAVTSWKDWQALGYDQHSIIADPGFKDPEKGDFTLPEDSPASQIGFKPFPLDEAGPRMVKTHRK